MCNKECVPAVCTKGKKKGKYPTRSWAIKIARKELTKRDGPPPFPDAVCRHLCENDSMVPNGFVCTIHTTWGTYQENRMDQPEELRKKSASIERTCPHCGRTIKGVAYFRYHGENCKMNPKEEV